MSNRRVRKETHLGPFNPTLKTPLHFTSRQHQELGCSCDAPLFVTVTITVLQKHGFLSLSTTYMAFAGELKLFRAPTTSVLCADLVRGFFSLS